MIRLRSSRLAAGVVMAVLAPVEASTQSLAARVAQAPDGIVRVQFASRPGTCGDGRELVGYGNALFAHNFQSIGSHWNSSRCEPGPLRVSLTVAGGQVTRVRTQVGGDPWAAGGDARVTDLGVVPAREASQYFFSLVPQLERMSGKDRLLLPAVLADDAEVIAPLRALGNDASRALHTRQQAILWLGLLEDFAYLRSMYARIDRDDLKESVMQGVSQDDAAESGRWLMDHVRSTSEPLRVRRSALFWAGQREATPTEDLVAAYRDARDTDFREHAIFVLSQRSDEASTDALLRIAREDSDTRMRGKALFWLAQKNDPRVTKLIADLILK
jgi:hypothetical protein